MLHCQFIVTVLKHKSASIRKRATGFEISNLLPCFFRGMLSRVTSEILHGIPL